MECMTLPDKWRPQPSLEQVLEAAPYDCTLPPGAIPTGEHPLCERERQPSRGTRRLNLINHRSWPALPKPIYKLTSSYWNKAHSWGGVMQSWCCIRGEINGFKWPNKLVAAIGAPARSHLWSETDVTSVLQLQMEPGATWKQGKNEQAANSTCTPSHNNSCLFHLH